MNRIKLIVAWGVLLFLMLSLLLTFLCFSYADNLEPTKDMKETKQNAPELIIHEEDLTYDSYKDSLKFLKEALDRWEKGEKYDPDLDYNYIGIPNRLLRLEGYGLKAQRDIVRLELKNAKLNGATKAMVASLESKLKEAEKRLKDFLEHNIWVD